MSSGIHHVMGEKKLVEKPLPECEGGFKLANATI